MTVVRLLEDSHNIVGESPLWHPEEGSVYWTDINGFRIQRHILASGEKASWFFGEPVCAMSLTTDPKCLLVALGSKVILWRPSADERTVFACPEPNWPRNRLNDGATDPNGVFWVGSMGNNVAPDGGVLEMSGNSGSLYRVAPDGQVSIWDSGFGITNTLAWSPDRKTFYCGCSVRNIIYAYDYDWSDSSIGNRRPFVADVTPGLPDGSAMDDQGFLWNCRFHGSCILRFSPAGRLDKVVEMPVSNITNCVFGGPRLDRLFVTTASLFAKGDERYAGGVFEVMVGVRGLPPERFRLT
ncbi:MAG: gluconolaconase [Acidobacteria bacterium]|nr:MAG: gluconolaconase [Acidobacteriota bacterium]